MAECHHERVLFAGNTLPVGDVLLSFPVALLMSEGKEAYVQGLPAHNSGGELDENQSGSVD